MEKFDISKLLKEYPLAGKQITKYIYDYLSSIQLEIIKEIPSEENVDIPTINEEVVQEFLINAFTEVNNLQLLLFAFDAEGVYMSVFYDDESQTWVYRVTGIEKSSSANSRTEATVAVIPWAFESLQNKLNNNVSTNNTR